VSVTAAPLSKPGAAPGGVLHVAHSAAGPVG